MKRLIIEKSDDEFYTSHSGLALAGLCINRYSDLSSRIGRAMDDSNNVISQMDIIRSYIGLLCLGKSDFEALAGMREDEYFRHAMGIETVPSVERLRQRMDETASVMTPLMFKSSVAMLRRANVPITSLPTGHIPLDIDVFPQDNSGTKGSAAPTRGMMATLLSVLIWARRDGVLRWSFDRGSSIVRLSLFLFCGACLARPES